MLAGPRQMLRRADTVRGLAPRRRFRDRFLRPVGAGRPRRLAPSARGQRRPRQPVLPPRLRRRGARHRPRRGRGGRSRQRRLADHAAAGAGATRRRPTGGLARCRLPGTDRGARHRRRRRRAAACRRVACARLRPPARRRGRRSGGLDRGPSRLAVRRRDRRSRRLPRAGVEHRPPEHAAGPTAHPQARGGDRPAPLRRRLRRPRAARRRRAPQAGPVPRHRSARLLRRARTPGAAELPARHPRSRVRRRVVRPVRRRPPRRCPLRVAQRRRAALVVPRLRTRPRPLRPGWLLLRQLVLAGPDLGVTRIDLGRGDDEYKRRAKTGDTTVCEARVESGSLGRRLRAARREALTRVRTSRVGARGLDLARGLRARVRAARSHRAH